MSFFSDSQRRISDAMSQATSDPAFQAWQAERNQPTHAVFHTARGCCVAELVEQRANGDIIVADRRGERRRVLAVNVEELYREDGR